VPINFTKKRPRFISAEKNINWVLNNLSRDEIVSTNWNSCMAYVLNADPQYYWVRLNFIEPYTGYEVFDEDYIDSLETKKVPVIASYESNLH